MCIIIKTHTHKNTKDIYVKIDSDPSPFFNHQHIATRMISTGIIAYVYFIVIVT